MKIFFVLFLFVALSFAKPLTEIDEDEDRIVGGQPTDIRVYPYQVSLRRRKIDTPDKPFSHSCGGSIFDKWTILTAAHCVIGNINSQMKIVAGTSSSNGTSGIITTIAETIFHEEYNPETLNNDVAILILEQPLPLDNFTMKAIELTNEEYNAGTLATLSGWGRLASGGGALPYELRTVQVPLVDRALCKKDYGRRYNITEAMICAGFRGVGGKDTCQGDSGGPLVINDKLVGIVSWGIGCARPDYPGVYAKVKYFVPWFTQQIAEAKARHNII